MGDAHAAAATTLSGFTSSVAAGISTGMGFKDVTTAMAFVRSHALHQNKQLRDDGKTRCGTYRKLVCTSKNCPFYVRFKKTKSELSWIIVAVHLFHAPRCTSVAKPKPRELVQLDVFKNVMAANPNVSASKLAAVIQDESGMEVETHTADRARRLFTHGAEASDAGGGSARKRTREGDADNIITESDSATTVEEDAHLVNNALEPCDPLPPLRDFHPEFHSTGGSGGSTVQIPERAIEQRTSNFNRAQLTVGVTDSLQRLLHDFQHLNDGSLVRCEYNSWGLFVRAFASCGVFTRASSKNQQVFGFECIAATSTDHGFHMYLLGKDANMETVVLAVAVVDGHEATPLDLHEWFFRCVLNTAVDIKTGAVIATLTYEVLAVSAKLGLRVKPCARSLMSILSFFPAIQGPGLARVLADQVARDRIPLYGWSTRDFLPVGDDEVIDTIRAFITRQQPMCPFHFMESVMKKWRRDAELRDDWDESWELITGSILPAAKKMWEQEWRQWSGFMTEGIGGRFFFGDIEVDTDRNTCSCGFMGQHGIPCRHMTVAVFRHGDVDDPFWNRFASIYRIDSYRSVYEAKIVKVPVRKLEESLGANFNSSPRKNQPGASGFKTIDCARDTEKPPPQKKHSDARYFTTILEHDRNAGRAAKTTPRRRWINESPNGASPVSLDVVEADATIPHGMKAGIAGRIDTSAAAIAAPGGVELALEDMAPDTRTLHIQQQEQQQNGTDSTVGSTRHGAATIDESDSDGDADMDGENDRMTDAPQAQPPPPSLSVTQQQDEVEDVLGGFYENLLALASTSSNQEVEYLGSKTHVVDERTRLAEWHQIKQRLELVEIETPANGSCLYFAFHAILSSECGMRATTIEDQAAVEDADGYRQRLNGILLDNFDELWEERTIISNENTLDLRQRLHEARFQSCVESAPREVWGGELQIKAAVIECCHPITVFDVQSDGRVLACVYSVSRWSEPAVARSYLSVLAAIDFVSILKKKCVVPLVLVLHRLPSGGHFNALRLASQDAHREWTRTETKRQRNVHAAREVIDYKLKHSLLDALRDYE